MTDRILKVQGKQWILYVAPIALVAIAAYHVIKDFRWGYTWGFSDQYAFYIYGVAAAIFVVNVFSKRWDAEVALWARRATFALLALVASWVHTQTAPGREWVYRQTTVDIAANLEAEQADRYWAAYTERLGDTTVFGGVRKMYEIWGAGLMLNQHTIFLNAINSASIEDLKYILDAVDGKPLPIEIGYLLMLICFAAQIWSYRFLHATAKNERVAESSTDSVT